jgi:hypothetical protein
MTRNPLALALAGLAAIVAVALLVVAFLGEGERGGGHAGEEHDSAAAPRANDVTSGGYRLAISLSPEAGKVGEIVTISGRVTDPSGQPVRNVRYELVSHHLEDDVPVFRTGFVSADGTFSWGNQFWDGTEHELRIAASPADPSAAFPQLRLTRVVDVEAVAPPLGVQVRALLWLLLPVALGTAIGIPLGLRAPRRPATNLRRSSAAV